MSLRLLLLLFVFVFASSACDELSRSPDGSAPEVSGIARPEALDGDSLRTTDGVEYRLIGINAPDRGECLAEAAAGRLEELVEEGVVFETDAELEDQFGRRLVYAYAGDLFVNERLVEEGLALGLHSEPNSFATDRIFSAMERAVSARVGLWDPEACGGGTVTSLEIVEVQADPRGPDEDHLSEEYVVLENTGTAVLDLTGWSVRDESTRNRYRFPDGFALPPGERVTITSGSGPFGFGTDSPIWNNAGDTVFVVDPRGRFVTFVSTSESGNVGAN